MKRSGSSSCVGVLKTAIFLKVSSVLIAVFRALLNYASEIMEYHFGHFIVYI